MTVDEAWEIIKKLAFPYKHLAKSINEQTALETMEKFIKVAKGGKVEE